MPVDRERIEEGDPKRKTPNPDPLTSLHGTTLAIAFDVDSPMEDGTFSFPENPGDMTGLPLLAKENPFHQTSRTGDPPHHLPPTSVVYSRAVFPKLSISLKSLLSNLLPALVDKVKANPAEYLAIVPFGAGKKFNADNPFASLRITEFIKSLGYDHKGVSVAKASHLREPSSEFDTPWIYFLIGAKGELHQFLVWQQTFAINPHLAFSVVPFDSNSRSWIIAFITGDFVANDATAKNQALGVIKHTLWNLPNFRRLANQCLAAANIPGSAAERAFLVTKTFDLCFAPLSCDDPPMWALTGKPITEDDDIHREYLKIIRDTTYLVGMHKLDLGKSWIDCVWCKMDTHPAHHCSWPQMQEWIGPKPVRDPRLDRKVIAKTATRGSHSRGGRGAKRARGSHRS
jgi:hypothetical protein